MSEPCLCGDPECVRCFGKRKRGRPRGIKHNPINISLDAELDAFAVALGEGNRSKGIAIALKAAKATVDGLNGVTGASQSA